MLVVMGVSSNSWALCSASDPSDPQALVGSMLWPGLRNLSDVQDLNDSKVSSGKQKPH